jgi:hypothetical protein
VTQNPALLIALLGGKPELAGVVAEMSLVCLFRVNAHHAAQRMRDGAHYSQFHSQESMAQRKVGRQGPDGGYTTLQAATPFSQVAWAAPAFGGAYSMVNDRATDMTHDYPTSFCRTWIR